MCGIVGFIGKKHAAEVLLSGLRKLEYRGYDSAGIAIRNEEKTVVIKARGHLENLDEKIKINGVPLGTIGIGHTRWATHGEPTEVNAHPHISSDGKIIAVHNGIIENERELRAALLEKGFSFSSQTDTETAVNLLACFYRETEDAITAIVQMMKRLKGSYALAVLFDDRPNEIFAVRKDSPLIIGISDGESYIASDIPALLSYTRRVYYMENMEIARLERGNVTFFDADGKEIKKELSEITWSAEAAEKNGFEHFMMKEIHEQPRAVRDTLHAFLKDDEIDFSASGIYPEMLRAVARLQIIGCGSAYHVGITAGYVMENLAHVPVRVDYASEFRYRKPIYEANALAVIISQSGETADSLSALREAKLHGVPTLAIVNVIGSSIAREADHVLYTHAGPEIAVATTKAYSAQLAVCYLLAIAIGRAKERLDDEKYALLTRELLCLPEKIEYVLSEQEKIRTLASKLLHVRHIFMIGRGLDYAVCMEGSLKVKEISYIHSEAYAAGELKHGTISLIENDTPVIGILTQKALIPKTVSNLREVQSRGAYIVGITMEGQTVDIHTDFMLDIPETDGYFAASLAVIPLQLLGYYISTLKGFDVDKPRNLAKSVTVE